MKNDQFIQTTTESFERLFQELFMGNPGITTDPEIWKTREDKLIIDGPPVVYPELPYFEFTRRSPAGRKKLGPKQKYEFRCYCTPGNAKKLKAELGYEKYLAALKTIEIASLKDIADRKPKPAAAAKVASDFFVPKHPEYQDASFRGAWDKAQHVSAHLIEGVGGVKIPMPADLYAHVTSSLYALSAQGFDVSNINVFRAFAREAKSMKFRNKSTSELIQLFADQTYGIDIDMEDERKHRQFPPGHRRQVARNLFDFIECLGDCHPEDFTADDAAKFEVWLKIKRQNENANIKKRKK